MVYEWAWLGVKYYEGGGHGVRSSPEATYILSMENTFFKRVAMAYFDQITVHIWFNHYY